MEASFTYVLVDAPLIPDASLKLDLLECSSLPGIDKRAIKFKRNGRLHLVVCVSRVASALFARGKYLALAVALAL